MERFFKYTTPLLALLGFIWAIYEYTDTARMSANVRVIEAAKPLNDKRFELYVEVTKLASVIATSGNQAVVEESVARFKQLYWGELGLVEGKEVTKAMVQFKAGLDEGAQPETLQGLSLALAQACRDELRAAWDQD